MASISGAASRTPGSPKPKKSNGAAGKHKKTDAETKKIYTTGSMKLASQYRNILIDKKYKRRYKLLMVNCKFKEILTYMIAPDSRLYQQG